MTEHPAVAFLRNAHQRAEELARAATPGPWEAEGDDPTDDEIYTCYDGEHGDLLGEMVAFTRGPRSHATMLLIAHAADPVAVLRRIQAERDLLVEHAENWGHCSVCGAEDYDGAERAFRRPLPWPCPTVLAVVRGWGWTETEEQS